jgi:hypothetical protein
MLLRIVAPHFVAGVIATNYVVTEAAPIVRYMLRWRTMRVWTYCQKKGWQVDCLDG